MAPSMTVKVRAVLLTVESNWSWLVTWTASSRLNLARKMASRWPTASGASPGPAALT